MFQNRKKKCSGSARCLIYTIGIIVLGSFVLLFWRPAYWEIFSADEKRYPTFMFFGIIQEEYFADASGMQLYPTNFTDIEDGDILVTDSTFCLCYRHGHAALVIDAEKGILLEAYGIGTRSEFAPLHEWRRYPHVMVLRLKAPEEVRRMAAEYAKTALFGIPYRISCGMVDDKDMGGEYWGTQCAHLVWAAFRQVGFDIDGDGGWLVTPADFTKSELLEPVLQEVR